MFVFWKKNAFIYNRKEANIIKNDYSIQYALYIPLLTAYKVTNLTS